MRRKRSISIRVYRPNRYLYQFSKQIGNIIWVFHLGDADPFPSVPHGHSSDHKYKLDVWTGNVINCQTKKIEKKVRKKELAILYNDKKFKIFAFDAINEYTKNHPEQSLYKPDWMRKYQFCSLKGSQPSRKYYYCLMMADAFIDPY